MIQWGAPIQQWLETYGLSVKDTTANRDKWDILGDEWVERADEEADQPEPEEDE